jgi:phage gp36-like protein
MARSYCGTNDVKRYLPPNVVTEGENPIPNFRNPSPETASNIDLDFFIQQASADIDANLATQYDVPLKQVNIGGEVSYPHPIPVVCAILAAQMYYSQALQGADKQFSDAQKERFDFAQNQLIRIQNGEIRLFGQRNTRGDRFVRSTLRGTPLNPVQGERRSKGKSQ